MWPDELDRVPGTQIGMRARIAQRRLNEIAVADSHEHAAVSAVEEQAVDAAVEDIVVSRPRGGSFE
jgi:hypothetical protein